MCKEGFTGEKCDRCAFGYRDFPLCTRCECSLEGSHNIDPCRDCICKVRTNHLQCLHLKVRDFKCFFFSILNEDITELLDSSVKLSFACKIYSDIYYISAE